MKYGVAVTIVQTGYIEVEADCEAEAKAKAEEAVSEDRVLYHETEVKECEYIKNKLGIENPLDNKYFNITLK